MLQCCLLLPISTNESLVVVGDCAARAPLIGNTRHDEAVQIIRCKYPVSFSMHVSSCATISELYEGTLHHFQGLQTHSIDIPHNLISARRTSKIKHAGHTRDLSGQQNGCPMSAILPHTAQSRHVRRSGRATLPPVRQTSYVRRYIELESARRTIYLSDTPNVNPMVESCLQSVAGGHVSSRAHL